MCLFSSRQVDGFSRSSLIFYNRPDTLDAKLSEYEIAPVADPDAMRSVLAKAHGVRGEVEKTRKLFIVGQTRVHVDFVKDLGNYVGKITCACENDRICLLSFCLDVFRIILLIRIFFLFIPRVGSRTCREPVAGRRASHCGRSYAEAGY